MSDGATSATLRDLRQTFRDLRPDLGPHAFRQALPAGGHRRLAGRRAAARSHAAWHLVPQVHAAAAASGLLRPGTVRVPLLSLHRVGQSLLRTALSAGARAARGRRDPEWHRAADPAAAGGTRPGRRISNPVRRPPRRAEGSAVRARCGRRDLAMLDVSASAALLSGWQRTAGRARRFGSGLARSARPRDTARLGHWASPSATPRRRCSSCRHGGKPARWC